MSRNPAEERADTLVIGTGRLVRELLEEVRRHPRCGYRIDGIVVEPSFEGDRYEGHAVLGTIEELDSILRERAPERIIVTDVQGEAELFEHHLLEASVSREVRIEEAAAVFERLSGKLPLEAYGLDDVIYTDTFRPGGFSLFATRLMSLVVASAGLLLCAPLMVSIALLIKLDSPGPVLFVQERAGYRGRRFKLAKFRTMRPADGPTSEWEGDNADRITRVGHWLRKYRLDELPQFFNVLRGDMNLVGPRPHPSSNIALLALVARNTPDSGMPIPFYTLRSSVRPGITGWAQVRFRYANNLQEEIEKLRYDLYYLKHYSLRLDLRILLETAWVVVAGHVVKSDVGQEPATDSASPVTPEGQTTAP